MAAKVRTFIVTMEFAESDAPGEGDLQEAIIMAIDEKNYAGLEDLGELISAEAIQIFRSQELVDASVEETPDQ
jgi:hypothetical protein